MTRASPGRAGKPWSRPITEKHRERAKGRGWAEEADRTQKAKNKKDCVSIQKGQVFSEASEQHRAGTR